MRAVQRSARSRHFGGEIPGLSDAQVEVGRRDQQLPILFRGADNDFGHPLVGGARDFGPKAGGVDDAARSPQPEPVIGCRRELGRSFAVQRGRGGERISSADERVGRLQRSSTYTGHDIEARH